MAKKTAAARAPKVRVSLFIDKDLQRRAKMAAARLDIPLYRLVAHALQQHLSRKAEV